MHIYTIRKRNGKKRLIYSPSPQEKHYLRCLVPRLTELAQSLCDPEVVHGFLPGHSPVTNALKHVGFQYTLSLDLQDFFDSVERKMIPDAEYLHQFWPPETIRTLAELLQGANGKVFPDGRARQGLPTSPIIANIAAAKMDADVKKLIMPFSAVYTRYADDLVISCNRLDHLIEIRWRIKSIVEAHGFTLNQKKTRIQWAGYGRRIITGVAVDDKGIYPTRSVKRRLRAALHQKKRNVADGLAEWMCLKLPNPNGPKRISRVQRAVSKFVASKLNPEKKSN